MSLFEEAGGGHSVQSGQWRGRVGCDASSPWGQWSRCCPCCYPPLQRSLVWRLCPLGGGVDQPEPLPQSSLGTPGLWACPRS